MEHLYVDESGSMTHEHSGEFPYFVICSVRVKDTQKVKRMYKRFVSKYFNKVAFFKSSNLLWLSNIFSLVDIIPPRQYSYNQVVLRISSYIL